MPQAVAAGRGASGYTPAMAQDETVELRRALVEQLRKQGGIETEAVAQAFLKVPREAFVPGVWPGAVYRDIAIPTRFGRNGLPTSSSSQPGIMAPMLEMLRVRRGDNVLEIGAGTGYNAALLQELTGPEGSVTSIDFQPDVAGEAQAHLKSAGYNVEVRQGDGAVGAPDLAPFDRIIVTAACKDVPVAWWEQLRPGGVLVLPLRRGCIQIVVAMARDGDGFVGERSVIGGFMSMQGGTGPAAALRYLGPRKDIAIIANSKIKSSDSQLIVRLIGSPPRSHQADVLAEIFPPVETPAQGEFWQFLTFLAACEPHLITITTRTEVYGFRAGSGLLATEDGSLAIVAPEKVGAGRARGADFRPELLAFGGTRASEKLVARMHEFVTLGKPGMARLRLSLQRTTSAREPWRYSYDYAATRP
jgi:protein-L-isoaspartate(D-aspartate) O-methyltransferase